MNSDIISAMNSPIIPPVVEDPTEESLELDEKNILLAILKQVTIMAEGAQAAKAAPDPSVFGTTPVQLEL